MFPRLRQNEKLELWNSPPFFIKRNQKRTRRKPNARSTNTVSVINSLTRRPWAVVDQAPCLAFSAQMRAMMRESSALCANCSCLVCSSTSSLAAMSLLTLSILFWRDRSLASVLSKKGAEKVMLVGDCPALGMRMSSLRGGFFCLGACTAGGGDWGLWVGLAHA